MPLAAKAMAAGPATAMPAMAMPDGMACDHSGKPLAPDCQKNCPSMASCGTNCLQSAPASSAANLVWGGVSGMIALRDDAERNGLTEAPPPRPPRL